MQEHHMADHILTTHAGSLPRPDDLVRMMWDKLDNKPVDPAVFEDRVKKAGLCRNKRIWALTSSVMAR
jgi:hypothetical protein